MNFVDYCIATKNYSALNAIGEYTRLFADTKEMKKKPVGTVTPDPDIKGYEYVTMKGGNLRHRRTPQEDGTYMDRGLNVTHGNITDGVLSVAGDHDFNDQHKPYEVRNGVRYHKGKQAYLKALKENGNGNPVAGYEAMKAKAARNGKQGADDWNNKVKK